MNCYHTITGQDINLSTLPAHLIHTATNMIQRTHNSVTGKHPIECFHFRAEVRAHFVRRFIFVSAYREFLRGPLGEIYKDCCYRLMIQELAGEDEKKKEEYIHCLTFHPGKLLVDLALDGFETDLFHLGLPFGAEKILVWLLDPEPGQPKLTIKLLLKFSEALLAIPIPHLSLNSDEACEPGYTFTSSAFTIRERQLRRLTVTTVRLLSQVKESGRSQQEVLNEIRLFLGLNLAAICCGTSVIDLDEMTNAILEDILETSEIVALDLESEEVLGHLERFNLGKTDDTLVAPATVADSLNQLLIQYQEKVFCNPKQGKKQEEVKVTHPLLRQALLLGWEQVKNLCEKWGNSPLFRDWSV